MVSRDARLSLYRFLKPAEDNTRIAIPCCLLPAFFKYYRNQ